MIFGSSSSFAVLLLWLMAAAMEDDAVLVSDPAVRRAVREIPSKE